MRQLKITLFIFSIFSVLSLFWIFFYFLISLITGYYHVSLNPFVLHIASSILGVVSFGILSNIIGYFHKPKRLSYFQAIIQALRQMAKGNFEVDLDLPFSPPGPNIKTNPFIQLADSVHYMAKELGQLERVRQEFISNVSHEIQSPLTSIKGFAKALESTDLPEEKRQHYLQIIQSESDRLSKLSDNLLKLTVLENNRHPIHVETYRADRQIREVLLALEPQWSKKNLDLVIELDPVILEADQDLMNQVWMNLIQNSIKFTPEKGKVTVKLNRQKDNVIFEVSDSGIGIRPEDRIHLFERFYKADRSRVRTEGGNGLGLSIVKKIVDVHHGIIQLDSKDGLGTTVTVIMNNKGN
ncbi:GHKL domain-containing protein [Sporolactobacillus shoreae]|uniref:histidine kinase n=1 Tax=Sporolactobacillus shoreae TaxID=1465501 RepID=A0A4Z0GMG3_9BACL|nr:HAMP domain-containing sensor histidine kinase [Sporolactobacillus shoreae]TGA98198.1 GHKL domain-containing protein [Sporolactobacillus shoreae]